MVNVIQESKIRTTRLTCRMEKWTSFNTLECGTISQYDTADTALLDIVSLMIPKQQSKSNVKTCKMRAKLEHETDS